MKLCRMIVGVGMILALAGAAQAATLIGYWGFEEGSGTTTADGTGNNPDAILNGGAGWSGTTPSQLSHSSQSVEILDGSNGYVNLGNPAGLDSATDWSVSIWAYLISDPGYDHRGIISKRTGYSGKDWDSYIPDASTTGFLFRVAGQNLSGDVTMAD